MHKSSLIDIGANLTHSHLFSRVPELLAQAQKQRVSQVICTGTSLESSQNALSLSQQYPGKIFATSGVHPHEAKTWTTALAREVALLLTHPEIVAIGECGLDYARMNSSIPEQRHAFAAQVEQALTIAKPLFLHCRGNTQCFLDFVAILRDHRFPAGVVHCFTGTPDQAQTLLEAGYFLGVTGWICDDRRNHDLVAALPLIPRDRLLLETDAPYLNPLRSRSDNRPDLLIHVAEKVAKLLQWDLEDLITQVERNTQALFPSILAPQPNPLPGAAF